MINGGILNVNKPLDWSSLDVVRLVRRHTGLKRAGHAGTLDPAAEGVLPVCIGQATRLVEYLLDSPKVYRARIHLGVVTDTYDSRGQVVRTSDPSGVGPGAVEEALEAFKGRIAQVPPMYSALKRDGVPLYEYARAGKTVEREARQVEVYEIGLLDFTPPLITVDVECGRGFYLRSLAHDLGERLGCGAHLEHLQRRRMGPFQVESAVGIEELRRAFDDGTWTKHLHALDSVLLDRCAAILGRPNEAATSQGQTIRLIPIDRGRLARLPEGTICRAYSLDGELVGLLRYEGADLFWRPEKVFLSAN